jgi:hypothetical protein
VHLLAGLPVGDGPGTAEAPAIDSGRFGQVLAADWGWWRTVTGNLAKLPAVVADQPELVPPNPPFDPIAQAKALTATAEAVPKTMKWRTRARLGERVRWYELPEEVAH